MIFLIRQIEAKYCSHWIQNTNLRNADLISRRNCAFWCRWFRSSLLLLLEFRSKQAIAPEHTLPQTYAQKAHRPPHTPTQYTSLTVTRNCFTSTLMCKVCYTAALQTCDKYCLPLILRRSRTGTVRFYTSTSNKRAARPKLYTKSLTRDLKRMYSRFTLVRNSIKL